MAEDEEYAAFENVETNFSKGVPREFSRFALDFLRQEGYEPSTFDVSAYYDPNLSLEQNKSEFQKSFGKQPTGPAPMENVVGKEVAESAQEIRKSSFDPFKTLFGKKEPETAEALQTKLDVLKKQREEKLLQAGIQKLEKESDIAKQKEFNQSFVGQTFFGGGRGYGSRSATRFKEKRLTETSFLRQAISPSPAMAPPRTQQPSVILSLLNQKPAQAPQRRKGHYITQIEGRTVKRIFVPSEGPQQGQGNPLVNSFALSNAPLVNSGGESPKFDFDLGKPKFDFTLGSKKKKPPKFL
jgi:hypothetical protein